MALALYQAEHGKPAASLDELGPDLPEDPYARQPFHYRLSTGERITWHRNLPGGGVETGETLMTALERELREEGNIEITEPPVFFAVYFNRRASRRDHVAPWKSTYKIHFLANADITYVLTSGGHNAGIVAPPAEERHSYQVLTKKTSDPYVGPDDWVKRAPSREGSWWTEWIRFLALHSGQPAAPPSLENAGRQAVALGDAPGSYVLEQ